MHRKTFIQAALMAGLFLVWPVNMHAQVQKDSVVAVVAGANGLPGVPADKLPPHGTFWLVMNEGSFLMPMPFRPDDLKSAPAYSLGEDGSFFLDATGGMLPQPTKRQAAHGVTSADLVKAQAQAIQDLIIQVQEARLNTELGALPGVKGGMHRMTMGAMGMGYGADDLWLEVLEVDLTNHFADLRLHGTVDTNTYQLLYTNNLAVPGDQWTLDYPRYGDSGTNQTDYLNFFIGTNAQMFFRAHQANQIVGVTTSQDPAVEPNGNDPGQSGIFLVYSTSSLASNLNVYYRLSGAAQNGIDYSNLTGVVTLPALTGYAEIDVQPIRDNLVEGSETVTLTLLQTNSYLIASGGESVATLHVEDTAETVGLYGGYPDAFEPNGPPGIPAQPTLFTLYRSDVRGIYTNQLKVFYQISGTASNGVDYGLLTNSITFLEGDFSTNIDINPLADLIVEGTETVTLTLKPTNTYYIDPNNFSGTDAIKDSSTTISFGAVFPGLVIEPNGPPGIPAQIGSVQVSRTDVRGEYPEMDVFYRVSGTASNGLDYVLSGTLHFATNIYLTNLDVVPLADSFLEGPETLAVTLIATNGYFIDTNSMAAAFTIIDSSTTLSIAFGRDAVETNTASSIPGQTGYFQVTRTDTRNAISNLLTFYYQISGTASNGVDYTNLSGTVTFAPNRTATNIYVQTLSDNVIEGDETVMLTLLATNGYYVATNAPAATILIVDNLATNTFVPVVTNIVAPIGIDYHSPSNSLIVSYNYGQAVGGNPYNFARIYTNLVFTNSVVVTNVVVTNWSRVGGLPNEVKLATVKVTQNGFTNGDLYYANNTTPGRVGWLSANGSVSNLNFMVLTNDTHIHGGLYVDQTGVFSNNLIVVTGGGSAEGGGVWMINSSNTAKLLVNLTNVHLEGVITLTNDPAKWGPWAGKIITGGEGLHTIYTIATNGVVTTNLLGIDPEDFDIVPPNQNLYGCDPDRNAIIKVSSSYLTNYVGDLMITEAGEINPPSKLFFVHWDAATSNFVKHGLSYKRADGSNGHFEHVTFAPIDLPQK